MTKKIKRIAALLLAAVLLICISLASLAEETNDNFAENSVTIETTEENAPVEDTGAEETVQEETITAAEPETAEPAVATEAIDSAEENAAEEDDATTVVTDENTETTAAGEEVNGGESDEANVPEEQAETPAGQAEEEELPASPDASLCETAGNTEEKSGKATNAWIESEDDRKIYVGETAVLLAKAEPELTGKVTWEIRDDRWEKDVWEQTGTGNKLQLDVTEEMADYQIRFVLEDGTVSKAFRLNAIEKNETENTEATDAAEPDGETDSEAKDTAEVTEAQTRNEDADEETGELTEEGVEGKPEADAEASEENMTAAENAAEEDAGKADEAEEEEQAAGIIRAWITVEYEDEPAIGSTIILTANAEPEMTGVNIWQTRSVTDEAGDWQKIGYGDAINVEITEENAGNLYRFVMQDGTGSEEFRLGIAEETGEESSEGEASGEAAEEADAEEDAMSGEAEEEGPDGEALIGEENSGTEAPEDSSPELPEEPEERELPEDRSIAIVMSCDEEHPGFGSVIHFTAELKGYEDLKYTVQWVKSTDNESWVEVEGATGETMDVVVTKENYQNYWRVIVTVEGYKEVTD